MWVRENKGPRWLPRGAVDSKERGLVRVVGLFTMVPSAARGRECVIVLSTAVEAQSGSAMQCRGIGGVSAAAKESQTETRARRGSSAGGH
jgi:hypothetical protein